MAKINENPFQKGLKFILIITGLSLILIAIGVEYYQYQRKQDFLLNNLKNRLIEHAANINLRVRTTQGYVQGLKNAAETTLYEIKHLNLKTPLFPLLADDPTTRTYTLDITNLQPNKISFGNLQGIGTLEDLSSSQKEELQMALLLYPFFEFTLKNNRGTVWISYRSVHPFQSSYPWVPNFSLSSQTSLKSGWSPILESEQFGKLVSYSTQITDGEKPIGMISLDISLSELDRVMSRSKDLEGSLFLVNSEKQVLGTFGVSKKEAQIQTLNQFFNEDMYRDIESAMTKPNEGFTVTNGSHIFVASMHETPWMLIYVGSNSTLFKQIFYESLEDIFIMAMLLIFVVGAGYILVIRNFIRPAQKLINHISLENQGLRSETKGVPLGWKPWFEVVSKIFKENRHLVTDLEDRVKKRTLELEQKNKQLEKTLTDLKKAQQQIIVQEKLASLGSLTAGIAHEIKNPLNFIINFTELSREYIEELKEKGSRDPELFALIEQNITKTLEHAERADSIVKSMLAHARGSSNEIISFDLNKLVKESLDLALTGYEGKKSRFICTVHKKFDEKVGNIEGSKQDIARVILNIINNGCYAMDEKKQKIGATYTPELTITTSDSGKKVKITIEDNGPGMNKSVLKNLFTPFFTTKNAGEGTGLGLSLSYDIITHQHHGSVTVESQIGEWTRFTLELPKGAK